MSKYTRETIKELELYYEGDYPVLNQRGDGTIKYPSGLLYTKDREHEIFMVEVGSLFKIEDAYCEDALFLADVFERSGIFPWDKESDSRLDYYNVVLEVSYGVDDIDKVVDVVEHLKKCESSELYNEEVIKRVEEFIEDYKEARHNEMVRVVREGESEK